LASFPAKSVEIILIVHLSSIRRLKLPWYEITNISEFDSPCIILYKERVLSNIQKAIARIANADLLRPHVKTNKIAEVCRMMMENGITKFKCATIAEAEMLAMINAPDVLIAYQPVGPRITRYANLVETYPETSFSCIVDDQRIAAMIADEFVRRQSSTQVYVDLNTGMNRTGIGKETVHALIDFLASCKGLHLAGIHAYDGHVKDPVLKTRQQVSDEAYKLVEEVVDYAENKFSRKMSVVTGGSPSFATHLNRNAECSPGTFVFWDWGYYLALKEEPYEFAAILVTRVISVIDQHTITTDLGHKSVAAENPLPRVHFLNADVRKQLTQSEEHLTLEVGDSRGYSPGDVLYAVPWHVCPTVALYDEALIAEDHEITNRWPVLARKRKITI
jgi:D-serine deaminase-like pyridoxal phosphate-dependent protein